MTEKPLPIREFIPNLREAWREWTEEPGGITKWGMTKVTFWYCWYYMKAHIIGHYDAYDDNEVFTEQSQEKK